MVSIDIRHDLGEVAVSLDRLKAGVTDRAALRALNRAATTVQREGGVEIRKVYNLPAKEAKRQFRLRRATPGKLVAVIGVSGRPVPLAAFGARRLARNAVSVKVLRVGARKLVRGKRALAGQAFIQTMPSGHVGIFQRLPGKRRMRSGRYAGKLRQPIVELFSIDVAGAFTSRKVFARLATIARERFRTEFERNLRFLLTRR